MIENFITVSNYWSVYLGGIKVTIYIFASVVIGAFLLAIPLTLLKIAKLKVLNVIGYVYTDIFRSIPTLVILYLAYFAVPTVLNININATFAAFIALSMVSAAYASESLRGGVEAIDVGQKEAAQALGIPYYRTLFSIVLPQALRSVLPALVNEMVGMLKSTALISIIGVADIMRVSRQVMANTYITFEPLIVAAVLYYILVKTLSFFAKKMEKKLGKSARELA